MTTLAEIAKAAGVSPAVVSRIINKDESLRVGKETRRRVEELITDMEYAPNIAARSLKSAKSGVIAMAMHDITNPVYSEILRGAQEAAGNVGNSILISDASSNARSSARLADLIGGGGVDGLILQTDGGNTDNVLLRAVRQNVPTVLLQAALETKAHLISLPDETATRMATQHLVDLGHEQIGCVGTVEGLTFTTNRLKGWQLALEENGIDPAPSHVVFTKPVVENGIMSTAQLLDKDPNITAIVYFNTMVAIGALQELNQRGLKVPEDISIISVHDIKLAEFLSVPLTTVSMPLFEMGQRAIELVHQEQATPDGRTSLDHIPPRLNIRNSTTKPR